MSRLAVSILTAFALLLIFTASSSAVGLPPWTRFKLPNGLEVLIVENHLTPIVTIEIAVKNGSFTEPAEFNGLSHLYEHMFFTSNVHDITTDAFLERADRLGADWNGHTQEEFVNYHFTLSSDSLKPGLDFMADAMITPLFNELDLQQQRKIVIGEFDRNEAQPYFYFFRKLDAAMWGDWLVRKEPLGQRSTILTATHEKMLAIHDKYYIPNNALLIVSGDVDTKQVRDLVPEYFDKWKSGPDPFKANPPVRAPDLTHSTLVLDTVDNPQVICQVRWHGPSIGLDDKATYVADVFSYIITQSEQEFTKSLVESGLAQSVGFKYYTQRYVGPITAQINTTPEHLDTAMKLFWSNVAKFDDPNYFSDEEFETAKNAIRTQTLYQSEKLSTFSHEIAEWWADAGFDYFEHYLDNLSKITRADVAEYVHRYIQGKPYVMGLAMSKSAAIVTEPSLTKLGRK